MIIRTIKFLAKVLRASVFLFGVASIANAAPDPNFHIYIAFGQSNMAGASPAQEPETKPYPRFKLLPSMDCPDKGRTMGVWTDATSQLANCDNPPSISVADYFGRAMVDSLPDVTVGIISVAVGGTALKLFDKDGWQAYLDDPERQKENWIIKWAEAYDSNLYKRIVDLAKIAQKDGVIKGVIVHQGESDWNNSQWAEDLKKIRDDMFNDLGLSADTVPLLAGEMREDGCCKAFSTNQVQRITKVMDNAWPVSSTGLGSAGDNYHFSRDGYVEFGKRYAKVMLEHMQRGPAAPPEPSKPYNGVAAPIPGKIEVENYDEPGVGSIGKSYVDNDSENKGGAYRKDGVDIEELSTEPGSYAVGYTENGEWLKYTVNVKTAGDYSVVARVASASRGSAFHLEMDGKIITDTVKVDSIGSWSDYKEIEFGVASFGTGEHVLKLVIDGSYVNIDWLNFVLKVPVPCGDENCGDLAIGENLHLNNKQPVDYKIFDLNGTNLGVIRAAASENALDLQKALAQKGLHKGVYLLNAAGKNLMVKLMVKN